MSEVEEVGGVLEGLSHPQRFQKGSLLDRRGEIGEGIAS